MGPVLNAEISLGEDGRKGSMDPMHSSMRVSRAHYLELVVTDVDMGHRRD